VTLERSLQRVNRSTDRGGGTKAGTGLAGRKEPALKRFACSDVVPGCSAKWVCETDDEILTAVGQHAARKHGLTAIPADLLAHMRSKIMTVAP
jgi:predicted small metal-binding protein